MMNMFCRFKQFHGYGVVTRETPHVATPTDLGAHCNHAKRLRVSLTDHGEMNAALDLSTLLS